jgi:hypothetical protein
MYDSARWSRLFLYPDPVELLHTYDNYVSIIHDWRVCWLCTFVLSHFFHSSTTSEEMRFANVHRSTLQSMVGHTSCIPFGQMAALACWEWGRRTMSIKIAADGWCLCFVFYWNTQQFCPRNYRKIQSNAWLRTSNYITYDVGEYVVEYVSIALDNGSNHRYSACNHCPETDVVISGLDGESVMNAIQDWWTNTLAPFFFTCRMCTFLPGWNRIARWLLSML